MQRFWQRHEQAVLEAMMRSKVRRIGATSKIPFWQLVRCRVGWMQFFRDLWSEIIKDEVTSGAAVLAYFSMLSIFPAAILVLSLLPYLPIPNLERAIMASLYHAMPAQAADLLTTTVTSVVTERRGGLLSFGILGTLWAASSGLQATMKQLQSSYDAKETRPYWKLRLLAIFLVFAVGILVISSFALVIVGDFIADRLLRVVGDSVFFLWLFHLLRWATILLTMMGALSLVYYFGPNVDQRYRFLTPGGLVASALFIISSLGFRTYVEHFGSYDATYGSLGAAIVLLLWLYVGSFVILIGSEVNGLLEGYARQPAGIR